MVELIVAKEGAAAARLMRGHVNQITPAAIAALEKRETRGR